MKMKIQQRSGKTQKLRVGLGQQAKAGQVVDPIADPWDRGQHSKLNCSILLGEERTKQS
jgi:hypothetical protein